METVVKVIGRRPPGAELMVAGDFNVDILAPEGRRAENIATDLATAGVEDMAQHFMPRGRRWCRDRRTWDMRRQGQVVRSRTDYILGTDRRLFQNVAVQDPGTTRTTTWSLGVGRAHLWKRQSAIRGTGDAGRGRHRRSHRGWTHSLRLYGEPYRKRRRGRRDKTPGSRRRRGGSSTRGLPRAKTRGTARRTGGPRGGRSDRV